MEENLTIDELQLLLTAIREKERREQKFAAALKGIDLEDEGPKTKFDEVKERVNRRLRGETEEAVADELPGFLIQTE